MPNGGFGSANRTSLNKNPIGGLKPFGQRFVSDSLSQLSCAAVQNQNPFQ
jgi:hypothetical protein